MSIDVITKFLGTGPMQDGLVNPDKLKCFHYKGCKLVYEFMIDVESKEVSISGDFELPFGFNSLFEFKTPYDSIAIETEPECYGERPILVFRKFYQQYGNMKSLMIMKWDNRELSVWPYPVPGICGNL